MAREVEAGLGVSDYEIEAEVYAPEGEEEAYISENIFSVCVSIYVRS